MNSGEDNQKFWDEIYEYLDNHYDLEKVKKIYVNSDGGGWIKAGMKRIAGAWSVFIMTSLSNIVYPLFRDYVLHLTFCGQIINLISTDTNGIQGCFPGNLSLGNQFLHRHLAAQFPGQFICLFRYPIDFVCQFIVLLFQVRCLGS